MKSRYSGFTLIEIMTAVAILAVLITLAVPSFRQLTQNNRVIAIHNDLVTAFNVARSESLKRNVGVSVCASIDGEECATEDDWAAGWIVFTEDPDGEDGAYDADDELLQQWSASGGNVVITSDGAVVQYQPGGMVTNSRAFSVEWDGCTGPNRRDITVSVAGFVSSQKSNCS